MKTPAFLVGMVLDHEPKRQADPPLLFWLPLLLAASIASAQSDLVFAPFTIAGGGGTSTGAVYSIKGTVGQSDAGRMSGGAYVIRGGFWSLYVVQTPGAPLLNITYSDNQAVVSWSSSATGWTLQTNNNLAAGGWGNYAGAIINNTVTNSPPRGNLFFRLNQ